MLYRLTDEGSCLVTRQLATGEKSHYHHDDIERFLEECESVVPLDALDEAIGQVIANTTAHDSAIDAVAAPAIRLALPLSRREASHAAAWRYLAVVRFPELVRHRFEMRSWSTMRTRFWAPGTRPDSNTLSRLWWIAELTRDGDDYELTGRVFARQTLATNIFIREFSFYRPAVEAFVDVLGEAVPDDIERVVPRFRAALSTLILEGQSHHQLRELLVQLRDQPHPQGKS
jgi:hypothetical protein